MQDGLYSVPKGVETRWASAENLDGARGAGGQAHFGRKGAACKTPLKAGEQFVMAHAEGVSGVIRRMWVTISERTPELLRGIVIRMYWDGADKPAVEAPLNDFFCLSLGRMVAFENAWFDNPEGRSFNIRIPMPFRKGFKIEVTNESPVDLAMFFYDVNYTLGDTLDEDSCYFHAYYRRENPTMLRQDYEILPHITGRGRYLGCNVGCAAKTETYGKTWWGEGEVKIYLDGDMDFPTLCGTGTEDYIATGWGQGQYAHLWHGCPIADHEKYEYSFYRLHGPDPVYFSNEIRVVIQQLGCPSKEIMIEHMKAAGITEYVAAGDGTGKLTLEQLEADQPLTLFEREDDWSSVAYLYHENPAGQLPAIDPYEKRVEGLTGS